MITDRQHSEAMDACACKYFDKGFNDGKKVFSKRAYEWFKENYRRFIWIDDDYNIRFDFLSEKDFNKELEEYGV